jgi:hypothetical protein
LQIFNNLVLEIEKPTPLTMKITENYSGRILLSENDYFIRQIINNISVEESYKLHFKVSLSKDTNLYSSVTVWVDEFWYVDSAGIPTNNVPLENPNLVRKELEGSRNIFSKNLECVVEYQDFSIFLPNKIRDDTYPYLYNRYYVVMFKLNKTGLQLNTRQNFFEVNIYKDDSPFLSNYVVVDGNNKTKIPFLTIDCEILSTKLYPAVIPAN